MSLLHSLRRHPGALIGLALLALVVAVALAADWLSPGSAWQARGEPLLAPLQDRAYPLGTDMLGRDLLAGLIHGARVSLLIGGVSTAVAVLLGVTVGALAGYRGGLVDDLLMRLTEFFQTVPGFAMAIVLVAIFQPSLASITLAIAVVSWPPVARLVRGEFLSLKQREFVQAAIVVGLSERRIILSQILPNAASPIIVMASLMVASAILTESALSFLGLGDRNLMSWGFMIGAGRTMLRDAWWLSVFPGLAILLTVLAINLVGDALGEALTPHRRGGAPA